MENEKLVETVAQHTVEIANIKENVVELKDTQRMMYEMNTNIKLLVEKIGNTNEELVEMKDDITGIKSDMSGMKDDINDVKTQADKKDAKKWNSLVKQIITIVVSVVVGIVLAKIGLQ